MWLWLVLGCREPVEPLDAAVRALGQEAVAVAARCDREVVGPLKGWTPPAAMPVTPEQVEAACDAGAVFDRHHAALVGRSRTANKALNGVARIGEDARVLALELRTKAGEDALRTAVDHIVRSVPEERPGFERAAVATGEAASNAVRPVAGPDVRRIVQNDMNDLGGLEGAFHNYAWAQRTNPKLVRGRLLRYFGDQAQALAEHHHVELGEDGEVLARYLVAVDGCVQAYQTGAVPFLAGTVRADEAELLWGGVQRACGAWRAAQAETLAALP
jgi:hypothetical protein